MTIPNEHLPRVQNRKKVFFFLYSLNGGGAERIMLSVLQHMDHARFEGHLLLCECSGDYAHLVPPGIPVHDLQSVRSRRFNRFHVLWALLRIFKDNRPQLIISTSKNTGLLALLACVFLVIPARAVMRLTNMLTEKAKEDGFDASEWASHRWLYFFADMVIAPSQAVLNDFQRSLDLRNPLRHRVILNFVDEGHIQACLQETPVDLVRAPGTKRVILMSGRLMPRKRYELALEAFRLLTVEDQDVSLWILGHGPSLEQLKKLAMDLGISHKVFFPGFQKNPYAFLQKADVFLMTSLFEGCPNVVLEAVYLGKPVVTTKYNDSVSDLVEHGVNGYVIEPDPKALALGLKAILFDAQMSKKMSEASLEKGRCLTRKNGVAAYEKIFDDLLEHRL
ncbi:MAG: glycosyltransferase [Candidatus Omnitrophica bacterium]|nr:glycosyltransferase [Candidatus Omnitrophota bacterium]